MLISKEHGFSLIEIMVLCSLLFIIACTGCIGNYFRTGALEAEVKANSHTIQIALERYATDHSGKYPAYIMGGDDRGWDPVNGCRAITDAAGPDQRPPHDPLIHLGYMNSYPRNPFIDPGKGLQATIGKTGSMAELGYGDVRFGWDGSIMGNCLDDPRYLFDENGTPTRLQYTMLPGDNPDIGVIRASGPNSFYCMGGLESGVAFWPGQFFYRSAGDFFLENPLDVSDTKFRTIWGWPYMRINKYILGGYGYPQTEGLDVIRLTTKNGREAGMVSSARIGVIRDEYYQNSNNPTSQTSHPDFRDRVLYSNPEIFGGGKEGLMPQFPYYQSGNNELMFGAPDGYRDGIILVLTSGSDSAKFTEWQG